MLSPEYLKDLPDNIIKILEKLEEDILADISRRISKGMKLTETAEYQINLLQELGYIEEELASVVSKVANEADIALLESALLSYENEKEAYRIGGKILKDIKENIPMLNFINAVREQTKGEFSNFTNTLGFVDNKQFKTISKMYKDTLDYAVFQVSSGAYDYNAVLKQSVKKLSDSGLRKIDYKSGMSYHVDVAARRAVMTGISQITNRMTEMNIELMGTEYVEVTAHMGARLDHSIWQGKVYKWNR